MSSLLFIEQPAGVGFSYAVNGSTWTDDFIQSQNTYGFLLNFFKVYPEYRKQGTHKTIDTTTACTTLHLASSGATHCPSVRGLLAADFHIAGESYAGIYVPTLANRILDGNAAGQPRINLKGIAVGNGCMGVDTAYCGVYLGAGFAQHTKFDIDFMYGHGNQNAAGQLLTVPTTSPADADAMCLLCILCPSSSGLFSGVRSSVRSMR